MIIETVSSCRPVETEGRNPVYLLEWTERSIAISEHDGQESKGPKWIPELLLWNLLHYSFEVIS